MREQQSKACSTDNSPRKKRLLGSLLSRRRRKKSSPNHKDPVATDATIDDTLTVPPSLSSSSRTLLTNTGPKDISADPLKRHVLNSAEKYDDEDKDRIEQTTESDSDYRVSKLPSQPRRVSGSFARLRRLLLRPSFWTCVISIVAFWDDEALHGTYVYDDSPALRHNDVVNGQLPTFPEVFLRDFWGNPMTEAKSHKSFRPITTLTFRLNWILSEKLGNEAFGSWEKERNHCYGFHVANVLLHGIVTALVTESASFLFNGETEGDYVAQLLTGFLFAVHPVHAEAVSNMTSRGELLMSIFSLSAFLSFARHLPRVVEIETGVHSDKQQAKGRWRALMGVYFVPWICMTISLFCKEQGATALIGLVFYDFIYNHGSIRDYLQRLFNLDHQAIAFLKRTVVLAIETIIVCVCRYFLNGETSPDFVEEQNPAGFSKDRFTRIFSVNWVYCLYIRDMIFPKYLCPDWSGTSIRLIESWHDDRAILVLLLWAVFLCVIASLVDGLPNDASEKVQQTRRIALTAFFAFTFSPFLLSSNLIIVVGLMKADRVIYMPLMGFCILQALAFKRLVRDTFANHRSSIARNGRQKFLSLLFYVLVLVQLGMFCMKSHERNAAWSNRLHLWTRAYMVNPISHHTIYNYGYQLSKEEKYPESEVMLRQIVDDPYHGPSTAFIYAMVLHSMDRCDDAEKQIQKSLEQLAREEREGGPRGTKESVALSRSNLVCAMAYCTNDIQKKGMFFSQAIQIAPDNQFAMQQFARFMEQYEKYQKMLQQHEMMQKMR